MKTLLRLHFLILITSCATHSTIRKQSERHSYASYEDLKQRIESVINAHEEFNQNQKESLKKIFHEGLEKSQKLKIQESKLTQEMMESVLTSNKKGSLSKFQKEFKKIYGLKLKNINDTSRKIRDIINPEHRKILIQEFLDIRERDFDRSRI